MIQLAFEGGRTRHGSFSGPGDFGVAGCEMRTHH